MPPTPQPAHQRVASELASDVQTLLPCTSDEDDDVIDITEAIDTIDLDEYDTDQENEKDDDIVKEENGKDDSESEKDSEEDDDEVEEENKEYERNETTTPNSQPQSEFSTSRSSFHSSAGSFILTPPLTPSPNIYGAYKMLKIIL